MSRPRILDLSAGVRTVIDEEDLPLLDGRTPYLAGNGYVCISAGNTGPLLVHRLICAAGPDQHVDHIDGDHLNNTRANLRAVSYQINQVNRKALNRNNVSGHRGVAFTKVSARNPWRAQITVNHRNVHLGLFPTVELAIAARIEAERAYYGEECPR